VERSWFGSASVWDPLRPDRGRRHLTIYNGVDVRAIQDPAAAAESRGLRRTLGLRDRRVVGVVGRLRTEKGHGWLLAAMAVVCRRLPDARLLVVGDGPDRAVLMQRAVALGLSDQVLWYGSAPMDTVARLYAVMDVVAVPSVYEGFGLAAAEAMAAGRPVVAADVDGLREIVVHEKTGLRVPHGDRKTLAAYLVRLLSDAALADAMGKAGRRRVARCFSLDRFANAILSLYRTHAC
jgi:glycosyltransferase involved in cell wall biosynthesis